MKNAVLFLFPILLLSMIFSISGKPLTDTTFTNSYDVVLNSGDILSVSSAFKTIVGVDSTFILTNVTPANGWTHFMYYSPITKTADSVVVTLHAKTKNAQKGALYSKAIDTLAKTGGTIVIPYWSELIGQYFDLYIKTTKAATNDTIKINQLGSGRRKVSN